LSPVIGELLSGSSPPLEFFKPIAFLFMASLYGSGAIVVRELKFRWKKDFKALLLLGAAYGILEEGLMVKSFFDPKWMDLGIMGSFGRWAEVNWVWAEMLTVYHAVFSITIPIVLVELAYAERKEESWIGKRLFTYLIVVWSAVTAIGFSFMTGYRPPPLQYLLAIVAMGLFVYAAYRIPTRKPAESTEKIAKPRTLFILAAAGSTAFFLLFWGPYIINSPIIIMLLGMVPVFGPIKLLVSFDWEGPLPASSRLAIVAGALSFLIVLASLEEFQAFGMAFVGLGAILGILLLKRRMKARA
jgi:MFS family permease